VQVNVLAHDKNGPVAGLKQEDFVLMDGRKPRKIATFAVETSTSTIPALCRYLVPTQRRTRWGRIMPYSATRLSARPGQ